MSYPSCVHKITKVTYMSPISSLISTSFLSLAIAWHNSPNSSPTFNICLNGSALCNSRSLAHNLIDSAITFIPIPPMLSLKCLSLYTRHYLRHSNHFQPKTYQLLHDSVCFSS